MELALAHLREALNQYEKKEQMLTAQSATSGRSPRSGSPAQEFKANSDPLLDEAERQRHLKRLVAEHTEGSFKAQLRVSKAARERREAEKEKNNLLDQMLKEKYEKEMETQRQLELSRRQLRKQAARERGRDHKSGTSSKSVNAPGNDRAKLNRNAVPWSLSALPLLNLDLTREYLREAGEGDTPTPR
jgi:hypothetical protein